MNICQEDCLHCPYPDCVNNEVTTAAYNDVITANKKTPKQKQSSRHCDNVRKYIERHPEERKASLVRYRETHHEEILAGKRIYYEAHRDELNAKRRAYKAAHREEVNAKRRAYLAEHRDEINRKRREKRRAAAEAKKALLQNDSQGV